MPALAANPLTPLTPLTNNQMSGKRQFPARRVLRKNARPLPASDRRLRRVHQSGHRRRRAGAGCCDRNSARRRVLPRGAGQEINQNVAAARSAFIERRPNATVARRRAARGRRLRAARRGPWQWDARSCDVYDVEHGAFALDRYVYSHPSPGGGRLWESNLRHVLR